MFGLGICYILFFILSSEFNSNLFLIFVELLLFFKKKLKSKKLSIEDRGFFTLCVLHKDISYDDLNLLTNNKSTLPMILAISGMRLVEADFKKGFEYSITSAYFR